jgi:hypothetical protein
MKFKIQELILGVLECGSPLPLSNDAKMRSCQWMHPGTALTFPE